MKLFIKIILFILLTLLLNSFVFASDMEGPKKVLVLYSHQNPLIYSDLVTQGFLSVLESSETYRFEYYIEYMDLTRFSDELYFQKLLDFYRQKYSGVKMDFFIAVSTHALNFLLKYGDEFSPGTPIVFCAVGKQQVENLSLGPNVTGFTAEVNMKKTLDLALKLQPDTRRVVVVGGASRTDRFWETVVRKEFREYEDEIEFIYLSGLPMKDLLERVADQPEHSIIFYSQILLDGAGNSFDSTKVLSLISQESNIPIYSWVEPHLGHGLVGGYMIRFEAHGIKAGEVVLRILDGENPSEIQVSSVGTSGYMFDWRQLKLWGISERDLPTGSVVKYKDQSYWNMYKWRIIGVLTLCLIEGLLIFILLLNRSKRKQVEEALRESEEKYRLIIENQTDLIEKVDLEGIIHFVSPSYCRMYGEKEEDLLGKTGWHLVHLEEDIKIIKSVLEDIKKPPYKCYVEHRIKTKDGLRWFGWASNGVLDDNNNVTSIVSVGRDITERKEAEKRRKESEIRYRVLFETSADGILIVDIETKEFKYANPALCRMLGYSEEELKTMGIEDIHPKESLEYVFSEFEAQVRGEKTLVRDIPCLRKDGEIVYTDINATPALIDGRNCDVGFFRDITEHRQLEEQLRQSQKMEAIGTLAGGVAHDFNNLLTAMLGYSEMLIADPGLNDSQRKYIEEIKKASERAASLTQQLLAFSRKQILKPKILNINTLVTDIKKMLHRLIGEDIHLISKLDSKLGVIKADPGQVEQVIMNLVVNARDAMPKGGKLTIETLNVFLDKDYKKAHVDIRPGWYVMLAVSDTGHGMDEKTKERIFEPFFTTRGKGTGLGLSTIYGIVKQSGGYVWVYSELNKGTSFKIYFPRVDEVEKEGDKIPEDKKSLKGSETILIVEDEEVVRDLIFESLKKFGYNVIEAENGKKALQVCKKNNDKSIHILITDVIMPGMGGRELAKKLEKLKPKMKVIYISGYTVNAIVHHMVLDEGVAFLQKPFSPQALAQKVREVLDGT